MAIKTWIENGKTFYQIDVCVRSKANRSLRVQRRETGILEGLNPQTDTEAIRKRLNRIEVRLADEARREILERDGSGITWGDLVSRWARTLKEESELPNNGLKASIKWSTARGYIQAVEDFTSYITSAYWFTSSTSFANPAETVSRERLQTRFVELPRMVSHHF